MSLGFDDQFIGFLKAANLEAAIALLTKKYPHLRNNPKRQDFYIERYNALILYRNQFMNPNGSKTIFPFDDDEDIIF